MGLVRVVRGLAVELMVRDTQSLSSGEEECVLDGKVKMRTLTTHASPDAIKHMLAVCTMSQVRSFGAYQQRT
jgi:hypothetical protein